MSGEETFWRASERSLASEFLDKGYVVQPSESPEDLDRIRDYIADVAAEWLGDGPANDKAHFLNSIHQRVTPEKLNDLRLFVIRKMADAPWLRVSYFNTARRALETLVGNELAMQLRVNLSIQLPDDDSSLLPVHSDVWSGDSPYEVVLWIPYVDVARTKSMYILPRNRDQRHQTDMADTHFGSASELFKAIEPDLEWLDIPYGHVLLFTQNQMHGNVVNREHETRWSSNCRFKSLFSPYADKKLGEFFEPIIVRPLTQLGASYSLPKIRGRE